MMGGPATYGEKARHNGLIIHPAWQKLRASGLKGVVRLDGFNALLSHSKNMICSMRFILITHNDTSGKLVRIGVVSSMKIRKDKD